MAVGEAVAVRVAVRVGVAVPVRVGVVLPVEVPLGAGVLVTCVPVALTRFSVPGP
jgi:hypothetical protein